MVCMPSSQLSALSSEHRELACYCFLGTYVTETAHVNQKDRHVASMTFALRSIGVSSTSYVFQVGLAGNFHRYSPPTYPYFRKS
jgi:hypothetical protein